MLCGSRIQFRHRPAPPEGVVAATANRSSLDGWALEHAPTR